MCASQVIPPVLRTLLRALAFERRWSTARIPRAFAVLLQRERHAALGVADGAGPRPAVEPVALLDVPFLTP
jgi:hypothetical protein